jgi:hypothetical protein|tara:strand:- start:51 stop:293 length:243 start_codon:yes stop_codon:yes gene_type:complete
MENTNGCLSNGFAGKVATISLTVAILSLWTALNDIVFGISVWWFVIIFIIAAIKSTQSMSCCCVDSKKTTKKRTSKKKRR